ncbi:stage II sporulation protein M [Cohnella pontilimi]|uniref:Stage II sporulation protein M n=1 Tax=Cohnella pontilimi TaxID=2564100 RepID=A0A4U0F789_9BACL|nr:stage II sporulation protein M [Cohnella pontilimi]TJY38832.1 stage II sporulation protein M [Cohnella pontilimi]
MFSRKGLLQTWRDIRPYFIFSVILFFAGVVVGATSGSDEWIQTQLRALAEMAKKAQNSDNPQMTLFVTILVNNLKSSLTAMYLGIVAAIAPLVTLALNGIVMGYLFGVYADHGENVWLLIAKGILPHGIFELPAIFLACAFGIRLGATLLKGLFGALLGKKEPWGALARTAAGTVPALILIAAMLLVAAVIESTVTPWLLS